jgi:hypothetical protein
MDMLCILRLKKIAKGNLTNEKYNLLYKNELVLLN